MEAVCRKVRSGGKRVTVAWLIGIYRILRSRSHVPTLRTAVDAASASLSSVVLSALLSLSCLAATCTGAVAEPGPGLRGLDLRERSLAPVRLSDLEAIAVPGLAQPDLAPTSDDAVMAASLEAPNAAPQVLPAAAPAALTEAVRTRRVFRGQAFDTCAAPSLAALRAWRQGGSPYGAVGIYIGGRNRACAQPQLSAGWTRSADAMGWGLLPLYVGLQAPCLTHGRSARMDPGSAADQGAAEGRDAVDHARSLAIAPGSPLYLDMESYPHDGGCTGTVLQYTAAWSHAVRSAGYLSGFYSSSDSGISDLARSALHRGGPELPDVVWYARWDSRCDTSGYGALVDGEWVDHQRVHQFVGNTSASYGGVRITIDRNAVDAPIAVVR
jgi:hypothetical protein